MPVAHCPADGGTRSRDSCRIVFFPTEADMQLGKGRAKSGGEVIKRTRQGSVFLGLGEIEVRKREAHARPPPKSTSSAVINAAGGRAKNTPEDAPSESTTPGAMPRKKR